MGEEEDDPNLKSRRRLTLFLRCEQRGGVEVSTRRKFTRGCSAVE